MSKIIVTDPIQPAALEVLAQRPDVQVTLAAGANGEDELAGRVADAEAILVGLTRITRKVIDAAPNLKVVSRRGVGYDNVDLEALRRRQIPLAIVGTANASSVAEHTFAFILALAKQLTAYDRATRRGDWRFRDSMIAVDLLDKTLFLLGFGRIGQAVAQRAAAFGMKVTVFDPLINAAARQTAAAPVHFVETLPDGLAGCDFLSVHVPLTPQTRGLIGPAEFAMMKPGVFVVSTARGGIIDETALVDALRGGRIRGAGLDVFVQEPLPADHPLTRLDNVILSPHTAALSQECANRMDRVAAQNCLDAIDGKLDRAFVVPN
ncbi:MAG: hydroxyacid dehydrogenase [Verrucomicrobia bacterium]|nr:hydroxyacid dehydrogenase [Verrucomicrobiota bacterium]